MTHIREIAHALACAWRAGAARYHEIRYRQRRRAQLISDPTIPF